MEANIDRFPEFRTHLSGIHDYCTSCGQPVLGQNTKCVDCAERDAEQDWIDTVSNMSMDQIMDELADIFQGNEKPTFEWDGGWMELTYYGSPAEVAKGKQLMIARGTVKIHTAEDRMCIWLSSCKDELAIY